MGTKIKHPGYTGSGFDTWEEFQEYNQKLPCTNPRCSRKRSTRSKYCYPCMMAVTAYGDPNLRATSHTKFRKETEEIRKLIFYNYGHPLVTNFVRKITEICDFAAQGLPVWGKKYDRYLAAMDIVLKRSPSTGGKRVKNYSTKKN